MWFNFIYSIIVSLSFGKRHYDGINIPSVGVWGGGGRHQRARDVKRGEH